MSKKEKMYCNVLASKLDNIRVYITLYYLATSKKMNVEKLAYNELRKVFNDLILERKTIDEIEESWKEKAKIVEKEG